MVDQALRMLSALDAPGRDWLWLAVNIAPAQLTEPDFAPALLARLDQADVGP